VWLLATLFAFALVAVTFNTIRLQVLTRREEIEVSKLIGATDPFIRRPFLYFGTLQGLAGAWPRGRSSGSASCSLTAHCRSWRSSTRRASSCAT